MFYTEILPRALPVMAHPHNRTRSPYTGCPIQMSSWGQETRPRRCNRRQEPTYDDFLSRLFQFSDSEDEEESRKAPTLDALLKALFSEIAKQNGCPKSRCENEAMKKKDITKGQNNCQKEAKEEKKAKIGDQADNKSAKTNENTVIAALNMRRYDPNSIEVKISDEKKIVTITGKHVILTPYGPMMRQNSHAVPIPEGISPKDIRSFISPDGILYLKTSSRPDFNTTLDTEDENKSLRKTNVEIQKTARSTESVKDANARNEQAESAMPETTQVITKEADNILHSSPTENSHETKQEADHTTESTDENIPDADEGECLKQANQCTAPEIQNGFVVIESKSGNITVAKDTTNDDVINEVAKKDESNHVTVAQFDMAGFSADDISVNINEEAGFMEVSAKREEHTENGRFVREYHRAFPNPQGFSGNDFHTNITTDGVFSIRVPKVAEALTV